MFASGVTRNISIGEETVVIQKMSGFQLEKASQIQTQKAVDQSKQLGGELLAAIRDPDAATRLQEQRDKMTQKQKRQARYDTYDRKHILKKGIRGWSCKKEDGSALPTTEGIEDLDQPTADMLFHEIVDLSCGPVDADEVEIEQEKD